ncbi:hypothetical protein [Actinoallomurus rhizosphaericola]|uniref:hypothetical protein n=1 Tax=Actinoallomurus rhizosphaericola TaxID=2952536 RepID=UPI0020936CEB|nr:hypothetical protein [Actinoallomurus rhizosphaericola]MCO6000070.1 hypothetical protein [Actinoallomurus rhizosphaericola]
METLEALSSTRWECARVLVSLFILHTLREIAAAAEQPMVKPSLLRRRYPTRRKATFRQEFVHDPAEHALVLARRRDPISCFPSNRRRVPGRFAATEHTASTHAPGCGPRSWHRPPMTWW